MAARRSAHPAVAARRLERYWQALAHMHAQGVRITCGSDADDIPT